MSGKPELPELHASDSTAVPLYPAALLQHVAEDQLPCLHSTTELYMHTTPYCLYQKTKAAYILHINKTFDCP